ncbi:hypothetical protein Q4493_00200 [Colwellia sp. 1_MG-2023]|uniref:hypothetical protein n=1 Tax=Colwellia sp. 1_MG-2023 TaxID=3062649 RepID=UPI0026E27262|nr:hypothetical protein [Colwellia sp. 1_MG-2023]MDO6444184.1 hypothetical protein [Colwellia sp. 1_MG-2023]
MFLRFMLIEIDEFPKNECVNVVDMFLKLYRANEDKIYTSGFEHSDLVEIAELSCYTAYRRISKEVKKSVFDYPLVYGPRLVLVESINANLVLGEEFRIELVIYDIAGKETIGKLKLNEFVNIKCRQSGRAELDLDNKCFLYCPTLTLVGATKLCLRLTGEVRLASDIKVIAELDSEGGL